MTVRRPISLSPAQLDIMLKAVKRVPVQWRSRLLVSIADQLLVGEITDDAMRQVCSSALRRFVPMVGDAA